MSSNRPNVLVIMGDDIGYSNLSHYSHGLMGYQTPNIDRIAKEGVAFTDFYAEQSCTAGRAAFVTGQIPLRTGLTKVGVPGSPLGMPDTSPTIGRVFKDMGYRTAQFGKNHLGDLDEHLPTNHGFDEFFGVLYHLNALEQPEDPDFPTEEDFPGFADHFGPRGVIHSWADGRIEDTGPMNIERMVTADDEFGEAAMAFIRDSVAADEPFLCYHNTTHMHYITHPKPDSLGQAGRWQSPYHDTMVDHDNAVGDLLNLLDELGVADDTIVVYTTDNGAHVNYWPDGATTPFRSEKNTNWEGAYRVPCFIRWPERIPAGEWRNGIMSLLDLLPTLASAAGNTDLKDNLLKGHKLAGKEYKVHLDGFDQLDYLTGESEESARQFFAYLTDAGECCAFRFDNWKSVFLEQDVRGTYAVWAYPMVELRIPKLFNLRTDPYERADITSNTWWDYQNRKQYMLIPINALIGELAKSLEEYPPQQLPANYNLKALTEKLLSAVSSN